MKLLDKVRVIMKARGYADNTTKAYVYWIVRYIKFYQMKHPQSMGANEVMCFINDLVISQEISSSTQRQALCALVFLYGQVLQQELGAMDDLVMARRRKRIPVVLSRVEVQQILDVIEPKYFLPLALMYGAGLRVGEVVALRVKDVDFSARSIVVWDSKGRDRCTVLPGSVYQRLQKHITDVKTLHEYELAQGAGSVVLPRAMAKKSPRAHRVFAWQFVFPSSRVFYNPQTSYKGRFHLHTATVQRAVSRAVSRTSIHKRITCHTFRHSFATALLRAGANIRVIQKLLGHTNIRTTMHYTHLLVGDSLRVQSPLDCGV